MKKILEQANFYKNRNHFNIQDVYKIYSSVKKSSHGIRLKVYHSDKFSNISVGFDGRVYSGDIKKFKKSVINEVVQWATLGKRKQIFQDQWDGFLTDEETIDAVLNQYDTYDLNLIVNKRNGGNKS